MIHKERYTSLSSRRQWYARSALDKNFNAMAISINPKETFKVFNHPPDFAILLSNPGKNANNANGNAMAKEKPRKPIIGPSLSFCCVTSTNKFPIKGAVHENDTSTSVSAIKKIPEKLFVPAFESTLLVHEEGNVISNAPKKDIPKTMNSINTKMLNAALVDIWYNVSFPKIKVRKNANAVNMAMIENEYSVAFFIPCARDWLRFKKKVTVTGNIAYRHGCNTDINPHLNPSRKVCDKVLGAAPATCAIAV